jgi:hypothetical protein
MLDNEKNLRLECLSKTGRLNVYKSLKKVSGEYGKMTPDKLVSLLSFTDAVKVFKTRKVKTLKNKWHHGVIYVYADRGSNVKNIMFQIGELKRIFQPILGDKLQVYPSYGYREGVEIALYKT